MGVNIHGDFDTGMPQLRLNILEVKDIGAFHAAGHVVAQHMEGGGNAQPVPRVAVIPAEAGGAYGRQEDHYRVTENEDGGVVVD